MPCKRAYNQDELLWSNPTIPIAVPYQQLYIYVPYVGRTYIVYFFARIPHPHVSQQLPPQKKPDLPRL